MSALLFRLFQLLVFPGALYLVGAGLFIHWIDRFLVARWQGRIGPPWFQPLADLIKLLTKEDILPHNADKTASALLPILSVAATMAASLYIPSGDAIVDSFQGDLIVVLFMLSIPSLSYFLAGWVTSSIYGVIGGNRSLLQYFSYEVPLMMGLVAPAIYSHSWNIATLVRAQSGYHWHAFSMPIGFAMALVGLIGKLKRVPFDIPHAKSEIGAGPLTEYSGRKLALWKLSVILQTLVGLSLIVAIYLGGADRIWGHWGFGIFWTKLLALVALLSLVQVLYARLRIDQMAEIGWRTLVPLGIVQMLAIIWMEG